MLKKSVLQTLFLAKKISSLDSHLVLHARHHYANQGLVPLPLPSGSDTTEYLHFNLIEHTCKQTK